MSNIQFCDMIYGRKCGVMVLEVTSCPSITILPEYETSQEAHEIAQKEMTNLLSIIATEYSSFIGNSDNKANVSIEFAFITLPTENQAYAASIRLFIIVRAIAASPDLIKQNVSSIIQRFESLLRADSYTYERIGISTVIDTTIGFERQAAMVLAKDRRIKSIQKPETPYCLSFDRLGIIDYSRKHFLNEIVMHPNCYISFQLLPTSYRKEEEEELIRSAQVLTNLTRGTAESGIDSFAYTSVKNEADTYAYYADHLSSGVFRFNILIEGSNDAVDLISKILLQEYSGNDSYHTTLKEIPLNPTKIIESVHAFSLPWYISEEISMREIPKNKGLNKPHPSSVLPDYLTAEEAASLFHLPIGDAVVGVGLVINESRQNNKVFAPGIINGGDISIGYLRSSTRSNTIGLSREDLTKHMLVTGTPGSGKTTFLVGFLERMWNNGEGIPFLVIEPAKNEYRALIEKIPDLQIFTPGKTNISPFVFNPFLPPKNVRLETFKSALLTAFSAAVSMSTPLDKIFEDSINNCYGDHHWFDHYTSSDGANIFNISDFIACFEKTFRSIGYTGDAQNIGRAGVVRLKSLINLFDNYCSIPIEQMLKYPTVIELSAIESSEQKTLIIALILLFIQCYVNANRLGDGKLKNLVLLEEAHVLMDAENKNNPGEADPAAIAKKLIIRMLAEIRAYGVGMILADQSPRKVGTDVVALTGTKLSFRLVEAMDRQMIADSTGLNAAQQARLPKLKPGEALLYFGRIDEPEEIKIPDYRSKEGVSISLTDQEIKERTTYWQNNSELLRPYPECESVSECAKTCCYETRIIAREIARRIHNHELKDRKIEKRKVLAVLGQIKRHIRNELLKENYCSQLSYCVILHLLRLLRYNNIIYTKNDNEEEEKIIPMTEEQVRRYLIRLKEKYDERV